MPRERWADQKDEFDAVADLVRLWNQQPSIVDDDYPEWRHKYDRQLFVLVKAVKVNHGDETFYIRSRISQ